MKRKLRFDLLSTFASFFILAAPFMVQKSGCVFFWGETECPDCLKK